MAGQKPQNAGLPEKALGTEKARKPRSYISEKAKRYFLDGATRCTTLNAAPLRETKNVAGGSIANFLE